MFQMLNWSIFWENTFFGIIYCLSESKIHYHRPLCLYICCWIVLDSNLLKCLKISQFFFTILQYKTGTETSFCFVLKAVDWSYRRETSMEFHRYYWTYGLLSQRSVLHGHTAWGSSLGSTQNSLGNSQYSLGTTSCNHTGGCLCRGAQPRWSWS